MKLPVVIGFFILIFSGLVLGDIGDDLTDSLGYVFGGYGSEIVLAKIGLFLVLFTVVFWSLFKVVFKDNRAIAGIVAAIIAIMGTRSIPEEVIELLPGGFLLFVVLVGAVLLLWLPGLLSRFFKLPGFFRFLMYLVIYGAIVFFIFLWMGVSIDNVWGDLSRFVRNHPFWALLWAFLLGIWVLKYPLGSKN